MSFAVVSQQHLADSRNLILESYSIGFKYQTLSLASGKMSLQILQPFVGYCFQEFQGKGKEHNQNKFFIPF